MAQFKILKASQVESLGAGIYNDGGNLILRVRKTGARSWIFRCKSHGKVIERGIGPASSSKGGARSLAQARDIAAKMRSALAEGKDPATILSPTRTTGTPTFKAFALELIEAKRSGWRNAKHVQQWENTLEEYAYPTLGGKNPADVTLADVKAILQPMWATKTETATRLRQRIEAVLDYAAVCEEAHGRYNPARWRGNLDKLLPSPRKVTPRVHHAAAPYASVPDIMKELRSVEAMSAYCLRFSILTAARSGEVRGAVWDEFNIEARTWTVPAARMKAGRVHRVPLCDEAIIILKKMAEWRRGDEPRVFPGASGGILSDVAINKTLHAIAPGVTAHGFRSSFREWGAETTAFPSAALELALAHVNKDKVEEAYQRSDLFGRRIELMETWGRFCNNESGNVIQMVREAA